ncbi:MAG: MBL fold metallo-hydrolase, partial [Thermoanaerobaculia bacterium]
MRRASVPAVLAVVVALPAAAQTATPAPTAHHERPPGEVFRVKPLAGGVYALYGRGRGGNVGFFVGPEAVTVVDSQFKDLAPGIVAEIRKVTDKPIKFLVNTHHHGDHVGGNEVFRQFAMIVAHDSVRARMLASPETIRRDYPARLEAARKAGNEQLAK